MASRKMKALSIKQPWADLIVSGVKDIENRTWKTNFRGRVYVHASQKEADRPFGFSRFTSEQIHSMNIPLCFYFTYKYSAIIGEVDIVDCVLSHSSIWAEHETVKKKDGKEIIVPVWNWVLANPIKYDNPILNVKGALSFWEYERRT